LKDVFNGDTVVIGYQVRDVVLVMTEGIQPVLNELAQAFMADVPAPGWFIDHLNIGAGK
jgi:hypothetical protein